MEPGDEEAFNDVFNSVVAGVRPPRSLDVMRHLWHGAPGGPVWSWLVEAREDSGDWRIVGHHGLCPVRFTFGDMDLTFAKTVNTFLLTEFRNKFVYLRFERQCLEEVEEVFDATYTLTPAAARPRTALGYETVATMGLEWGAKPFSLGARVLAQGDRRYPNSAMRIATTSWSSLSKCFLPRSVLPLVKYDANAAAAAPFFVDFGCSARAIAGLAPRRDTDDLHWRFWSNGDGYRTTLTHTWPDGSRAYCILNRSRASNFVLEDIFLTTSQPGMLQEFLQSVYGWCTRQGALTISFMTTGEGHLPAFLDVYRRTMGPVFSRKYRSSPMSRRLTTRGRKRIGPLWPPCNITAAVAPA